MKGGDKTKYHSIVSEVMKFIMKKHKLKTIYKLAESYLKMKAGWDYPEAILLSGRRNYRANKEMTSST